MKNKEKRVKINIVIFSKIACQLNLSTMVIVKMTNNIETIRVCRVKLILKIVLILKINIFLRLKL